ncbi:MAG: glycosyltransferase, partial [Sphingobacteriales bacterium]
MPLLSVWITAYNHEKYIEETLNSVLAQQTNFEFDIVLGEDGSIDNTRKIVLEYHKKYPGKFKLFLPDRNLGMLGITQPTFEMCTGKYIAFLDGDDYWTDPLKLQKQVDLLESNPDISFCFHNAKVFYQKTGDFSFEPYTEDCFFSEKGLTTEDLLELGNRVWTLSVVMRNFPGSKLPSWFYTLPFPDLGMYYLLVRQGKGKYIDEVMGVYRSHDKGAWTGETDYNNAIMMFPGSLFAGMLNYQQITVLSST